MRPIFSAILLLTPLAACGGGESTNQSAARSGEVSLTNATVADVAAQTAAAGKAGALRFEPGEWQTTVSLEQANIPGMPPAAMKQMQGLAKSTSSACMTPAQAEKPNEAMFGGKSNCRFDRYTMADGKIDATMRCGTGGDTPGGGEAVITMKGSYAATSFDLRNSMTAAPVAGHPEITMTSHVVGKRLGACKN